MSNDKEMETTQPERPRNPVYDATEREVRLGTELRAYYAELKFGEPPALDEDTENLRQGLIALLDRAATSQVNLSKTYREGYQPERATELALSMVAGLSMPGLNQPYKEAIRWLRVAVREQRNPTPPEVAEQLTQWQGDPEAGRMLLHAHHLAKELQQKLRRAYLDDVVHCIEEVVEPRMAGAEREDSMMQAVEDTRTWSRLTEALGFARIAQELLQYEAEAVRKEEDQAREDGNKLPTPSPRRQQYLEASTRAATVQVYLIEAHYAQEAAQEAKHRRHHAARREWDEIRNQARLLYHRKIRLERQLNHGDFVVIDPASGDYEVSGTEDKAREALGQRQPGCKTHTEKVGYSATLRMSSRPVAS